MDWIDDVADWIAWGILVMIFLVLVTAAAMTLVAVIYAHFTGRRWRWRWPRRRRGGNKQTPLPVSIEELLAGIPDVTYEELPSSADDGGDGDQRESCAICVAPYEAGEPCSVLPPCTHMFHKACVAVWLRQRTTCPLCRATVVAAAPAGGKRPRGQGQGGDGVSAAENMV